RRFAGTNAGREIVVERAGAGAAPAVGAVGGVGIRIVEVCTGARAGVAIDPLSVPGVETDDNVSRLKARSRADWNRRSRSFSRQRRTRRSSGAGMFGNVSVSSGGSSLRMARSVSIDVSRLKARAPDSIS